MDRDNEGGLDTAKEAEPLNPKAGLTAPHGVQKPVSSTRSTKTKLKDTSISPDAQSAKISKPLNKKPLRKGIVPTQSSNPLSRQVNHLPRVLEQPTGNEAEEEKSETDLVPVSRKQKKTSPTSETTPSLPRAQTPASRASTLSSRGGRMQRGGLTSRGRRRSTATLC